MDIENIGNYYKEHKNTIIIGVVIALIPLILSVIVDNTLYFIKELIINYILLFALSGLFTFGLVALKKKKYIIHLWIVFFILVLIHGVYIFFKTIPNELPQINFYGLYDVENNRLKKTNADKSTDELIIKGIEENNFFKITNSYLPNHILILFEKEEILKFYKDKNNLFSILIYKENNIYSIVNFIEKNKLTSPYHTIKNLELIKNIFSEILNLNGSNKEEVIKDLLLVYQQNFIRNLSVYLFNSKIYDYQKAYETYNMSANIIYEILHKYKRLVTDSDLSNKINSLLNIEQAISKYTLAFISIDSQDYNNAVKNLIACLQLSPYFPYDNYEEFLKAYEANYHVQQIESIEFLKTEPVFLDIYNKDKDKNNTLQESVYTSKLSETYLEIAPPFLVIKEIVMENNINDETSKLIEKSFKDLLNSNNIFKFYLADIIKFLPKGKDKFNKIYLDRVDESKELLYDFIKSDNRLNDVVFLKLMAIYLFKQMHEGKNYGNEMKEVIKQIEHSRLIYGPTP